MYILYTCTLSYVHLNPLQIKSLVYTNKIVYRASEMFIILTNGGEMSQKYCEDCGGKEWCWRYKNLTKYGIIDSCPFKSQDEGRVRRKMREFEVDKGE